VDDERDDEQRLTAYAYWCTATGAVLRWRRGHRRGYLVVPLGRVALRLLLLLVLPLSA
jgi:hypothetical protein